MKVLLTISFLGAAYHGWQVQKNAPSVQKCVQTAAETLLSSPCAVTGCSRTDAGVHALRYFCTLKSAALDRFPLDKLPTALNRHLPDDVSALSARQVEDSFHPRYDALAKEYEYLFYVGEQRDPFACGRACMIPGRAPDLTRMAAEAEKLVGTHDFSSFCASGGKIEDKTRSVYYCRVSRDGNYVKLNICADGFLYNMVRIIAGTLLEAALGKDTDVRAILDARKRSAAGRTAPPEGLYLKRVFYNEEELNSARN